MKSKIVVNFLGSGFRHHQWPLITFFVCVVVDWRTPFTRIKKKGFRSQCGKERRVRIFETIFFFQAVMHRHRTVYMSPPLMVKKIIIRSAGTRVQVSAVLYYVLPDEM